MRYAFASLVLLHGLIHFMGFVKGFGLAEIPQLAKPVSRAAGTGWLLAALLLAGVALLIFLKRDWGWLGVTAALVSQVMIFTAFHDARFGTVLNVMILAAAVLALGSRRFEKSYLQEVKAGLVRTAGLNNEPVTEADLQHLPEPVQRYLRYAGVLNKPRVRSAKFVFEGRMRGRGKDWFPFRSEQYDFFDRPTRLFFMKGKMFGVTVPGYHAYREGKASMDIRLFGMFPVVDLKGPVLDTTETVTLFNDLCLMAPAALIDERIKWEPVDHNTAKAVYTVNGISIGATLYFNETGQLINFVSNDRTEVNEMLHIPFSTPVHQYGELNGYRLGVDGDAVWHYPDGDFVYGKFYLKQVEYNL